MMTLAGAVKSMGLGGEDDTIQALDPIVFCNSDKSEMSILPQQSSDPQNRGHAF